MPLSHADVRQVLDTLERVRDYEYVEITMGDFVLRAAKSPAAMEKLQLSAYQLSGKKGVEATIEPAVETQTPTAKVDPVELTTQNVIPEGMIAVRSPMAGIFYVTPGPNEPEFVAEGGDVALDSTVCLVEVMKLFNSVKAPIAGTVHKIIAVHGEPVEHDQILMIIEPQQTGGPK